MSARFGRLIMQDREEGFKFIIETIYIEDNVLEKEKFYGRGGYLGMEPSQKPACEARTRSPLEKPALESHT